MTAKAICALLVVAVAACAAPARAAGSLTRAWVASAGVDGAGCGQIGSPCRTLNGALANVVAGAEIDVVDAGAYGPGPVAINLAVSIVNDSAGTAAVQAASGNSAFVINAGASDSVSIRGFSIDGGGVATNGVELDSGAGLTLVNCVVRHFLNDGVLVRPSSGAPTLIVSNLIVSDNTNAGIAYKPTGGNGQVQISIDQTTAFNNGSGIVLDSTAATGGFNATVSNSIANGNLANGMNYLGADPNSAVVFIDNSYANANRTYGVANNANVSVLLSRSVVAENATGLYGGLNVYSYGDNRINRNGTDIANAIDKTTYVPH